MATPGERRRRDHMVDFVPVVEGGDCRECGLHAQGQSGQRSGARGQGSGARVQGSGRQDLLWDGGFAFLRPPPGRPLSGQRDQTASPQGLASYFRERPIGWVCAQRGFLDVSPWYESAFISCKIDIQCKRGKRGRMEKGKTIGLSAFPLPPCFPSFSFRKGLLSSSRQGRPLPKGCPPSLATNNLTSGAGRTPHVTGPPRTTRRTPPSDEGVPQAVDFFRPYLAREEFSRSTVTRRHEAGCRGVGEWGGIRDWRLGIGDSGLRTGHWSLFPLPPSAFPFLPPDSLTRR